MADAVAAPLGRLAELAAELRNDALVADATGEDHVKVGHEWATEVVTAVEKAVAADRKRAKPPNWPDLAWPGKVVVGSVAVFLASAFLALAAVTLALGWNGVDDAFGDDEDAAPTEHVEPIPEPGPLRFGPLDTDVHPGFEDHDACVDWAEDTYGADVDLAIDCAPHA